jgi:hypothetical protein
MAKPPSATTEQWERYLEKIFQAIEQARGLGVPDAYVVPPRHIPQYHSSDHWRIGARLIA